MSIGGFSFLRLALRVPYPLTEGERSVSEDTSEETDFLYRWDIACRKQGKTRVEKGTVGSCW